MPNTPTPEPQRYADAQLAALLDPSSGRDTILITPGSPMPTRIPEGLTVARTSRGIVITSDPSKVSVIDRGSERDVGMALFGYGYDQSQGFKDVAVAMDRNGTPVAELAIKPGEEMQAMRAASKLMPSQGLLDMISRENVVNKRVNTLLG
jgi:hypothetical protein